MVRKTKYAALFVGLAVALTIFIACLISAGQPIKILTSVELVKISNVVYVPASNTVLLTVNNLKSDSLRTVNVTFIHAFFNDADVTSNWASSKGTFILSPGESMVIALIVAPPTPEEENQVKIVTRKGNACVGSLRL